MPQFTWGRKLADLLSYSPGLPDVGTCWNAKVLETDFLQGLAHCWGANTKLDGTLYVLDQECGSQPLQLMDMCVLAESVLGI